MVKQAIAWGLGLSAALAATVVIVNLPGGHRPTPVATTPVAPQPPATAPTAADQRMQRMVAETAARAAAQRARELLDADGSNPAPR